MLKGSKTRFHILLSLHIDSLTMFDEKVDDADDNDDDDYCDDVEFLQDDEQQCRRSPWFARRQLQVKLFRSNFDNV